MSIIEKVNCIFCDNLLDGSDEHIIPDSVNGRLHTKRLICAACNQKFGSKLDPIIKETMSFVLFALGMGNVKKMQVTDQNGKPYIVDQAGKMREVAPEVEITKTDDGKIGISVNGEKNVALRAFAKKAARTFGMHALKLLDQKGFHFEEKVNFLTEVKGVAGIESSAKLKLALNKILTEFYAHSGLPLEPIKPRLDHVYNLDESGEEIQLCNFDLGVRQPKEGQVSHLIVIRSDQEKRQLYGYVEILNVLCAHTIFVNDYDGPEVDISYHQNALTGVVLDEPVTLNFDTLGLVKEDFEILINNTLENGRSAQQLARFNSVIDQIKSQLDEDMKSKISEGERDQQFIEAATKIAAQMIVFEFPDDVADFTNEEEKTVNYIHSIIKESGKEEFEFFYHQMIGREFPSEEDGLTYIMESFKYQKHAPKKEEKRLKAFCYFKAKNSTQEKYFTVKEIFDVLRLPPPPFDVSWL